MSELQDIDNVREAFMAAAYQLRTCGSRWDLKIFGAWSRAYLKMTSSLIIWLSETFRKLLRTIENSNRGCTNKSKKSTFDVGKTITYLAFLVETFGNETRNLLWIGRYESHNVIYVLKILLHADMFLW